MVALAPVAPIEPVSVKFEAHNARSPVTFAEPLKFCPQIVLVVERIGAFTTDRSTVVVGLVIVILPSADATDVTVPPPQPPRSAISCAVVFLSVQASLISTSSVPARLDLSVLLLTIVGSAVNAPLPVISPVCVALVTLALFVVVSASIWSRSTACVTLIYPIFVFSVAVANLFVAHTFISSVSSTDFMKAHAAPTFVASVTSANASIPASLDISLDVVNFLVVPSVISSVSSTDLLKYGERS